MERKPEASLQKMRALNIFLMVFLIILLIYNVIQILFYLNPWELDSDVVNEVVFRRECWK